MTSMQRDKQEGGVLGRFRRPLQGRRRKQAGVALLLVTVITAITGAAAGDFAYNARVDLEAAANSRDQLRAEYLAGAALRMGQLLVAVQGSIQSQLPAELRDLLVITDFAGFLAKAFGGDDEARAGLGGLVGLDLAGVQGMGTPKGTSFDLNIASEEGKFPINCGGGLNPVATQQRANYRLVSAMVRPLRYERMFGVPDPDGVIITREDLPRNIVDWIDLDSQRFEILGAGSGAEETYDRGKKPQDRYLPHNFYMDTVEELNLVRGVGEDFWSAFGEMFTVYGSSDCRVLAPAMSPDAWPLLSAMLAASSSDPSTVFDPNTAQVAQQVAGMLKTLPAVGQLLKQQKGIQPCAAQPACAALGITGAPASGTPAPLPPGAPPGGTPRPAVGGDAVSDLANLICNDAIAALPNASQSMMGSLLGSAPPMPTTPLRKIPLCPGALSQYLRATPATGAGGKGGGRRFFRIDATGLVQRNANKSTQVHIRGVWDAQAFISNPLCTNHPSCSRGTWVYYRID